MYKACLTEEELDLFIGLLQDHVTILDSLELDEEDIIKRDKCRKALTKMQGLKQD